MKIATASVLLLVPQGIEVHVHVQLHTVLHMMLVLTRDPGRLYHKEQAMFVMPESSASSRPGPPGPGSQGSMQTRNAPVPAVPDIQGARCHEQEAGFIDVTSSRCLRRAGSQIVNVSGCVTPVTCFSWNRKVTTPQGCSAHRLFISNVPLSLW
jgi:hypothetical protein